MESRAQLWKSKRSLTQKSLCHDVTLSPIVFVKCFYTTTKQPPPLPPSLKMWNYELAIAKTLPDPDIQM